VKRLMVPVLVSAVGLALASSANASVTVGQLFEPTADCVPTTALQTAVADGNSYTVPSAGVITSWSWQDGVDTVPDLELKVGRATGDPDTYAIVGSSDAGAQTASTVGTWPARVSVQAGDVIGVYASSGDCVTISGFSDKIEFVQANAVLGNVSHYTLQDRNRVPVQATVEPDADGDGFGDETQDQCLGVSGTVDGCPPPPPPPGTGTPPPGGSGTTGTTTPPASKDTTAPVVSASIRRLLRLSRKGTISFTLRSGENATGSATGTISLPKASRVVRFRTAKLRLAAGKRAKVTLRLSKRSLKSVRRALKHHRLKVRLTVTMKDAAGNKTVKRLSVKLRR
jgi:hypothetical protein